MKTFKEFITMNESKEYLIIDLYSKSAEFLPKEDFKEATQGTKKVKGDVDVWDAEEALIVDIRRTGSNKYLIIDLYSKSAEYIPNEDFKDATEDTKKVKGDKLVYAGEEYLIIVL